MLVPILSIVLRVHGVYNIGNIIYVNLMYYILLSKRQK